MKQRKMFVFVLLALVAMVLMGASGKKNVPLSSGTATTVLQTAYVSAQVDTLVVTREAGLSAASFGIYAADSINISKVILRRVVNGYPLAVQVGDTLMSAADSAASSYTALKAITLAPVCEQFWIIVTYNTDKNGINQSKDANTVRYAINRQYAK